MRPTVTEQETLFSDERATRAKDEADARWLTGIRGSAAEASATRSATG